MKKTLIALFALLMATAAFADYWYIDWQIFEAYSPKDSSVAVLQDYSVTWDLLWAASEADKLTSTVLGTRNAEQGASLWESTGGGEKTGQFNDYLTFTGVGDATFVLDVTQAAKSTEGFVYQKLSLINSAGETEYEWESAGATIAPVSDIKGNPLDIGGTDAEIGTASAAWTKVTTVPEPATMSLLGLGALAMVLRRRIRR